MKRDRRSSGIDRSDGETGDAAFHVIVLVRIDGRLVLRLHISMAKYSTKSYLEPCSLLSFALRDCRLPAGPMCLGMLRLPCESMLLPVSHFPACAPPIASTDTPRTD